MPRVRGERRGIARQRGRRDRRERDAAVRKCRSRPPAPEDEAIGRIVAGLVRGRRRPADGHRRGAGRRSARSLGNHHGPRASIPRDVAGRWTTLIRAGVVNNRRKTIDHGKSHLHVRLGGQSVVRVPRRQRGGRKHSRSSYMNDPRGTSPRRRPRISVNSTSRSTSWARATRSSGRPAIQRRRRTARLRPRRLRLERRPVDHRLHIRREAKGDPEAHHPAAATAR